MKFVSGGARFFPLFRRSPSRSFAAKRHRLVIQSHANKVFHRSELCDPVYFASFDCPFKARQTRSGWRLIPPMNKWILTTSTSKRLDVASSLALQTAWCSFIHVKELTKAKETQHINYSVMPNWLITMAGNPILLNNLFYIALSVS